MKNLKKIEFRGNIKFAKESLKFDNTEVDILIFNQLNVTDDTFGNGMFNGFITPKHSEQVIFFTKTIYLWAVKMVVQIVFQFF